MKTKQTALLYILLGLLAVGIGATILYNRQPVVTNKQEYIPEKNPDTIENSNKRLKDKKCIDNLCVTKLSISNQAGIYSVSATLKNQGQNKVSDKSINLVFYTEEKESVKKTYYISNLDPNKELPLEIQFTEKEKILMEVVRYELENSTLEEYNQVKNNIVD